jgi:hypothetical protein
VSTTRHRPRKLTGIGYVIAGLCWVFRRRRDPAGLHATRVFAENVAREIDTAVPVGAATVST